MKRYILFIALGAVMLSACAKLDLNDPSAASSGNWYKTAEQVRYSLNDFYRSTFYVLETNYVTDRHSDDWNQRTTAYSLINGNMTSSAADGNTNMQYKTVWSYRYKNISRANRIIEALKNIEGITDDEKNTLEAEARCFRAMAYSQLISLYGDVPFYLTDISPEQAFALGRTPVAEVLKQVYEDYDFAIKWLPKDNFVDNVYRIEKGAAYGFKARIALEMHDYKTAKAAAKGCMDLNKYSLFPDYGELFTDKTHNSEVIFAIPHSIELEIDENGTPTTSARKSFILRGAGGTSTASPSWDLLAAYECTDGLTIDESPLFHPENPYLNRDPRCNYTFCAPDSVIYGIQYNPSPDVPDVMDYVSGTPVQNRDSRGAAASSDATNSTYNSTILKKGATMTWRTSMYDDNNVIVLRYADVLLMYAEAMIECNTIDPSVLLAINEVRARAYKVKVTETGKYPVITTDKQVALRRVVRRERRVELAWEGRRFYDVRRWGILDKSLADHCYGHATGANFNNNKDKFYWPCAPQRLNDPENDIFYFKNVSDASNGLIIAHVNRKYDSKCYLLPIPDTEIVTMADTTGKRFYQNPGY